MNIARVGGYFGRVMAALVGRAPLPSNEQRFTDIGFTPVAGVSYGVASAVPLYMRKFGEHPWLKGCVRLVAEECAALKWHVWREMGDEPGPDGKVARKLARGHALAALWARPNSFQTGFNFRYLLQVYLEIAGECFVLINRGQSGSRPVELTIIPPHWVSAVPSATDPAFTVWRPDGGQISIPPEDVIWIQIPNPINPWGRGLGAVRSVDDEINGDDLASKWNEGFYRNGGKPGGILMIAGASPDRVQRIREEWNAQHQGVFNAFKTAFLGYEPGRDSKGGSEYHDLSKSHKDLDFIEGRKQYRDIILQAGFGIPPEKMGIVENSNRATAEESEKLFQTNVLRPRVYRLQDEWAAWLVPLFGENDVLLECEDPVQESKRWQAEHAVKLYQASLATKNEARISNNMPPVDGGDVYFEPKNADIVGPGDRTSDPDKERAMLRDTVEAACEAACRAVLGVTRAGMNGKAHGVEVVER